MLDKEKLNAAIDGIHTFLFEEYSTEHGVHAQSFLGALAAITGDVLLRTTEDLSSVKEKLILSDSVNDLIFNEDSDILDVRTILNDFAGDVGAKPKSEEEILAIFERTVENFGGESYPPLSIPKDDYPMEWSPNAAVRYRGDVKHILDKIEVEEAYHWVYCAHALGVAIMQVKDVVDPDIALQLCFEIIIGVSKLNITEEM